MPANSPDDFLLLIRCPSCSQRFKVGEDLRDKTVECGGCETRFRINDDVIVRGRRFYPGERKDPAQSRYQRVPMAMASPSTGAAPMKYANAPDPAVLGPTSPQRVVAGVLGGLGMVIMALILMFGGSSGGVLDGMVVKNRLLMAGFTCLIGVILLIYANPKARKKALGFGLLMTAGVLALPFKFDAGANPPAAMRSRTGVTAVGPEPLAAPVAKDPLDDLRAQIGTDPLVKEINRLAREGSEKQAVGLWLRGLSEVNRLLIRDYIFRTTKADASSANFYPRGQGDFLMVVTGAKQSLHELVPVVSILGNVENVYDALSVIEVKVNNENFTEGPLDKLGDKENPAFYDLNKRELESIDLERVKRAVQRLAESPAKIYRADISKRLIALLGEEDVDFKGAVCRALSIWADQPGVAGDAALKAMGQLVEHALPVPEDMMALVVKEKNPEVIPLLDRLWAAEPGKWEALYAEMGVLAETRLIERFKETEGHVRFSAVRILGKVGGEKSLAVLDAAKEDGNTELKILIEQAQRSIRERLGR